MRDFFRFADIEPFTVSADVYEKGALAWQRTEKQRKYFSEIASRRFLGVLAAFQGAHVAEATFQAKTGYGYGDIGRDQLDAVYARVFSAEDALVRLQFASGTHVLATCLRALLVPQDEILIASGQVYDTLLPTFGKILTVQNGTYVERIYSDSRRSLAARGVVSKMVPLTAAGEFDLSAVMEQMTAQTKVLYIQKSRGYSLRRTLLNREIGALTAAVKAQYPECIVFVDNCYGEFVEEAEPTAYGVDLVAGSLLKNPGGGIAPSGGYVCGRRDLVAGVAEEMTAVEVGGEVGASLGFNRLLLQGLYFAPQVVEAALSSVAFTAELLAMLGYNVTPLSDESRGDIVQCISLAERELLLAFCEAIQAAAPVDSFVSPIPSAMPGYDCDIIMASGSFIQGSSIELSADGPLREPFTVFLQGGIHLEQGVLGALQAATRVCEVRAGVSG